MKQFQRLICVAGCSVPLLALATLSAQAQTVTAGRAGAPKVQSSKTATKPATPRPAAVVAAPASNDALPLREVVLFSSGVGYFGREGRINGRAALDLSFRAEQINDVL